MRDPGSHQPIWPVAVAATDPRVSLPEQLCRSAVLRPMIDPALSGHSPETETLIWPDPALAYVAIVYGSHHHAMQIVAVTTDRGIAQAAIDTAIKTGKWRTGSIVHYQLNVPVGDGRAEGHPHLAGGITEHHPYPRG